MKNVGEDRKGKKKPAWRETKNVSIRKIWTMDQLSKKNMGVKKIRTRDQLSIKNVGEDRKGKKNLHEEKWKTWV